MTRRLMLLAATVALTGCDSGPAGPLPTDPDQLILYSVDVETWGRNLGKVTEDQPKGEVIDGYPTFGKVVITDLGQKRQVLSAIRRAVRNPQEGMGCFSPRHAVRAIKGGETVDLVICFHCHNYQHYQGGQLVSGETPPISSDPEPLFDKLLSDAGVPLAPKHTP